MHYYFPSYLHFHNQMAVGMRFDISYTVLVTAVVKPLHSSLQAITIIANIHQPMKCYIVTINIMAIDYQLLQCFLRNPQLGYRNYCLCSFLLQHPYCIVIISHPLGSSYYCCNQFHMLQHLEFAFDINSSSSSFASSFTVNATTSLLINCSSQCFKYRMSLDLAQIQACCLPTIIKQAITKQAIVLKDLHFEQNCRSHQISLLLTTTVAIEVHVKED